MKHLFSIALTILFVAATAGIPLSAHYCNGQLITHQLQSPLTDKPCDCPQDGCAEDCCKDELEWKQLDDEFVHSSPKLQVNVNQWVQNLLILPVFNIDFESPAHIVISQVQTLIPGIVKGCTISILHQVFLL